MFLEVPMHAEDGPILFLDIAGVLITGAHSQRTRTFEQLDPQAVAQLQRIVDETNCSLVLTSSWRIHRSLAELRGQLIAAGMKRPCPLIDKTPVLEKHSGDFCRGDEVARWIDIVDFEHPYVCVDDSEEFLPNQPVIRPTWREGLTAALADECIRILKTPRS